MIKKAFVMQVYAECHQEYERRHTEIWPEMVEALKRYGAIHYSIFFNKATNQLFAYLEIESEEMWQDMAKTAVCRKWWAYMKDIMATHPDNSPVNDELKMVFDLP